MACHSTFYDGLASASMEQLLSCLWGYSVSDFLKLSSQCFSMNRIRETKRACESKSSLLFSNGSYVVRAYRACCRSKDNGPDKRKESPEINGCSPPGALLYNTLLLSISWSMGSQTFVFHATVKCSSKHWEWCLRVSNFLFSKWRGLKITTHH